jgi:uncharacterized protein (DUF2147 family)
MISMIGQELKMNRRSGARARARALALMLLVMSSQAAADAIEGWWQSWDSLLYVSVEKGEARLFAAGILNPALVKGDLVSWSPEKPLLDIDNPDPQLRGRPLLGIELTENYRKKGKQWRGRLYDPRSGAWYKSHLTVVGSVLNIRGYIGMPMLGQTRTFERFEPCKVYEDAVMVVWSEVQPPACE